MGYIKGIFGRASIQGIADYLLFGIGPDADNRSYEERMKEPFRKFERAVRKYDPKPSSELLDLSNEVTSETAAVYTEIGLQIGILLMMDMAGHLNQEIELPKIHHCGKNSVIDQLYEMQRQAAIKEALQKEQGYQQIEAEIKQDLEQLGKEKQGECRKILFRELAEKLEKKCREYGRITYRQGMRDASSILRE